MNIEDRLKNTLHRAIEEAPPPDLERLRSLMQDFVQACSNEFVLARLEHEYGNQKAVFASAMNPRRRDGWFALGQPLLHTGWRQLQALLVPKDQQMGNLIQALEELWAACPVSNGTYVRLAAE